MKYEEYQKAIEAARVEAGSILLKRAALDERLGQLKKTIEILSTLLQEPPKAGPGLMEKVGDTEIIGITDAIRRVLSSATVPLSPVEIKQSLVNAGVNMDSYANAMAVIHNTLARLEKQGEVVKIGECYSFAQRKALFRGARTGMQGIQDTVWDDFWKPEKK